MLFIMEDLSSVSSYLSSWCCMCCMCFFNFSIKQLINEKYKEIICIGYIYFLCSNDVMMVYACYVVFFFCCVLTIIHSIIKFVLPNYNIITWVTRNQFTIYLLFFQSYLKN